MTANHANAINNTSKRMELLVFIEKNRKCKQLSVAKGLVLPYRCAQ